MLHRVGLNANVLITGASGGVGSAVVQLARRRGAEVIAVAGAGKAKTLIALGATTVIDGVRHRGRLAVTVRCCCRPGGRRQLAATA